MHRRLIHILLSRRLRRAVVLGALAVVALATATALTVTGLARGEPGWWRPVRRDDPATIETARTVEESLKTVLTRGRPTDPSFVPEHPGAWRSEPWSFSLTASEANAWLNVRLPLWLENGDEEFDWPEEVSELQVHFADGVIQVGANVRVGGREQILAATIVPEIGGDGSLSTPARWLHVGRLAIPPSWVLEDAGAEGATYVPRNLRALPETGSMFRAFLGVSPALPNPVIKLGDGRRVRILGVKARGDALVVECRTEAR